MASFFKSLSDDMEKVAQVVEEGAKIIMGTSEHIGVAQNSDPGGGEADVVDEGAGNFDEGDFGEDGFNIFDEDAEDFGSPLMGMADSVISDIMSTQQGPQSPMEHIQAFSSAITWEEPFIMLLLLFHLIALVTAIVLTRRGELYSRMGLMVFLGAIVRLAEWINSIGASRWRDFATQNYFDKNGIFIGLMLCAPLLFVCFGILLSMVSEASGLLVGIKNMKSEQKTRGKKTKTAKAGTESKKKK